LDPKEHDAYRWVSPEEAIALSPFSGNRQALSRATSGNPPLFLSRSGRFFQEGEEITHERTALLLHQSLRKAPSGYLVRIGHEELDVVVEDAPRFVRSYDGDQGKIRLADGSEETLDPTTLTVRPNHSLTCRTSRGETAVFLSPAYYELTKFVQESGKQFLFHFLGRDYPLAVPPQSECVDG
jgi:hypothetical protein